MGLEDSDPDNLSLWVGNGDAAIGNNDSVTSLGLAVGAWLVLKQVGGAPQGAARTIPAANQP